MNQIIAVTPLPSIDVALEVAAETRNWATAKDRSIVEAALEAARIVYVDLYSTPRPGVWQLEAYANAKRMVAMLESAAGFTGVKAEQDYMEDEPYALVRFSYQPESDDNLWLGRIDGDAADRAYEEGRAS